MPSQRCPNCEYVLDTAIYVSGTRVPCPRCGLSMTIERADVSVLRSARPATSSKGAVAADPRPEALVPAPDELPTLDQALGPDASVPPPVAASGEGPTVVRQAVQIPGYQLVQVIGRGGMGEVWQARQLSLGREVAIKILAPNLAREGDFVKRFEKEAAALAALSHPGVVQIIDRGQSEGMPYFVMEFVQGQSLRELMDAKKVGRSEGLKVLVQVATAIDYAHQRGVIHRDLKPENILIDAEGRVKVADFGLAGMRDDKFNVTRTAMTMGTLNYMAPEQRKDAKAVDHRADIFSLGVMLYELLTGDLPVGHFKLPSELVPGLDSRLDAVTVRALETDPAARFQRTNELIAALEGLLSTLSLPASALPDAPAPRPLGSPTQVEPDAPPVRPTRPDSPANLQTAAPEPSQPTVVTHVKRAGRRLRNLVGTAAVVLGGLAIATVVSGKPLLQLDADGLTVLGYQVTRQAPPEKPGELPRDHRGDVGIALSRVGDVPGDVVIDSPLQPGGAGSLIAWDGEWTADATGLTAREFGRLENEGERPRATLEDPAFKLRNVAVEVQVSIDPTPPAGYAPKTPRAAIFFRSPALLLELSMESGDVPMYQLTAKYTDDSGQLQTPHSGDVEFNKVAPPAPRTPVKLRLTSANGQINILADGRPILPSPMKLPAALTGQVGRIGLTCEEATCRFSALHVEGQTERNRELMKDDQHEHTVHAGPPEARVP